MRANRWMCLYRLPGGWKFELQRNDLVLPLAFYSWQTVTKFSSATWMEWWNAQNLACLVMTKVEKKVA